MERKGCKVRQPARKLEIHEIRSFVGGFVQVLRIRPRLILSCETSFPEHVEPRRAHCSSYDYNAVACIFVPNLVRDQAGCGSCFIGKLPLCALDALARRREPGFVMAMGKLLGSFE